MMNGPTKLAAVMVIYKQSIDSTTSYQSLLENSDLPLLVYDNSPDPQRITNKDIEYKHDPTNPGVSKAYNEAIKWAKDISATHLLLLDSDSKFPGNALESYKNAVIEFPEEIILPSLYSAGRKISPFYFSMGKTHYGNSIKSGPMKLGKKLAINAGSLLPLYFLNDITYNESLPLDWSDIYFFRKLGETNIKAQHINLDVHHGLSEHEDHDLQSVKFRFDLYIKGISIVSRGFSEKLIMYFWAKMKAFKLSFKHKTIWFFVNIFKNFYA